MAGQTAEPNPGIPTNRSRIVVVEGPEDKTFFCGLAEHLGIKDQLHFVACNGKDSLKTYLANILIDTNYSRVHHIGIICDNDYPDSRNGNATIQVLHDEIDAANHEVSGNFRESRKLPKPSKPRVPVGTKPKVSVLLLPDDDRDGMLENLVLDAIGEDEITKCTDAFFACLEKEALLKLQEAREPRSRLSVYISGKIVDKKYATNDDSRRWFLTQAVHMKWWNESNMWAKPEFKEARDFLQQLLAD